IDVAGQRRAELQCLAQRVDAKPEGAEAADARDHDADISRIVAHQVLDPRALRKMITALLPPNARFVDRPTLCVGSARAWCTTTSRPSSGSAGASPAVGGNS